jgi:hypothetical protein
MPHESPRKRRTKPSAAPPSGSLWSAAEGRKKQSPSSSASSPSTWSRLAAAKRTACDISSACSPTACSRAFSLTTSRSPNPLVQAHRLLSAPERAYAAVPDGCSGGPPPTPSGSIGASERQSGGPVPLLGRHLCTGSLSCFFRSRFNNGSARHFTITARRFWLSINLDPPLPVSTAR